MKDLYFMNKETGELIPGIQAMREFYATHSWREDWLTEWEPTEDETDTELEIPNFGNENLINI